MRTLKPFVIILLFFIGISLSAQDKMANNIDNSNIALQGYSPVSYLDLQLAQKGNKQFKSEYQKVVYYFTSNEQKATFDNKPAKYIPQFGGYCAFGIYAGAKFRIDPNKFIVEDGKYYLYLNNLELDAKQLWLAEHDHSGLKNKADKNWKKLRNSYN